MNAEDELLKAFKLVEEYNKQRTQIVKEYRLYYHDDGSIIGLWEADHPAGDNYIVINDPDILHRHNTLLMKVVDGELKIIDPKTPHRNRLQRSHSGQPVVAGTAAIALSPNEPYTDVEHYDRKNS
jgi:hypothetical protein